MSESPALERVRHLDSAFVDDAFAAVRGELVALCRPIVGDEAEDVAHDAYMVARKQIGQLRDPERAGAWIAKIALNLCFERHRRREQLTRWLPVLQRQPRQRHPEVGEAVAQLPIAERTAVVLFYGQGLPIADIASLLDRKPSTVRSLLFRARGRLRLALGLEDGSFDLGGGIDG